jgi:hypothetical protein
LLVAWSWRWSHHNPSSCQEQHSIKLYESVSPRRSSSWSAGMWRSVPSFWRNLLPLSSRNKCHISEDHSHNVQCHENWESRVYGTCCYLLVICDSWGRRGRFCPAALAILMHLAKSIIMTHNKCDYLGKLTFVYILSFLLIYYVNVLIW